jgi:hypothetical protein
MRKKKKHDAELKRERRMQDAIIKIKDKFGKNAILKGMNFEDGATAQGPQCADWRSQSMRDYSDIINLPRHVSKTKAPMPLEDRAAQFSPFAALEGHRRRH